jgi:periplasmic mercuric ion binding protein
MKTFNLKYLFQILALVILTLGSVQAQKAPKAPKSPKTATVAILTSANCAQCKTTIETALAKVKGIKQSTLDVTTHVATVVYSPKKLDAAAIRKAISMAGYDADELKADQEAHDNLPACCRKGGHD